MSGPSIGKLTTEWNDARGRSFRPDLGTSAYSGPSVYSTGASSVNNGLAIIDPSIRRLRESSLSDYLKSSGELRNRFVGNQSDYVNAILNPLRESLASRRGELQRSIGMRGLSGSSFGEQSMTNLDVTGQREIRDANALAQAQGMDFLNNLDATRLQAQNTVAEQNLAQELSALGLGQAQINQLMANFANQQDREQKNQQIVNKMLVDQAADSRGWYSAIMGGKFGGSTPSAGSSSSG